MDQTVSVLIANEPGKIVEAPYLVHEPIYFLMQRLIYKLGLKYEDICFHRLAINGYFRFDDRKSLLDYSPFGHILTFKYWTRGQMSLMVKKLDGKTLQVPCCQSDTVEYIKEIIRDVEGVPLDDQRLVFAGKQLEDHRTLQEYNIHHQDSLQLLVRLRGGKTCSVDTIQFADVSDSNNIRRWPFTKTAPPGRCVGKGTNVECQCECTLGYCVISPCYYSVLELTKDSFTCPNCHTGNKTTPITVGFWKCQYRFMGIKDDSGEHYTSGWFDAPFEDEYLLFDPQKQAKWRRLLIHSRPLDEKDKCIICLGSQVGIKTYPCGHSFHEKCYATVGRRCFTCNFDKKLQFAK